MSETFEYDVFLSYSSKDKVVVHSLAERLKRDGLRVWLDSWAIQPGDLIPLKIQHGLENSRTLLMCMSPAYFDSDWGTLEHHTLLFRDPTNSQRRFIPLIIADCVLPDIIGQFSFIDLRMSNEEAYAKLLTACHVEEEGLRKTRAQGVQDGQAWIVLGVNAHTQGILDTAITSDGQTIISVSFDGTLKVWDLATGKCKSTFEGHADAVRGVAVTPDDQTIVSASFDRTLKVWDLATGNCKSTFKGHAGPVLGVAVTSTGQTIVSASSDRTLKVWDLATGICKSTFKGHAGPVWGVAVTPDGQTIVSASSDRTLKVWELATGICKSTFKGHAGAVLGVAVTPDGHTIVSVSSDRTLKVWDLATGICKSTFKGHTDAVWGVAVTPDGQTIVSASSDRTLNAWDLATGKCKTTFEGHSDAVRGVSIASDARTIVSASVDRTLKVWDLATGKCKSTFEDHAGPVCGVAVTPDGRTIVSASSDRTLKVWDLATGICKSTFKGHADAVLGVAVTPDGQTIVSASTDRTLKVWDLATGKCKSTLQGHAADVKGVAVTPDGQTIVSASSNGTLKVWDLATGKCKSTLQGYAGAAWGVAVTPDGQTIVSASSDRTLKVWDLATGKCKSTFNGHAGAVLGVAVTPDGQTIVSASFDRTLKVWDLATGKCKSTFEGHSDAVMGVAVMPDGQTIVSASSDRTLKVWDLATGKCRTTLQGHAADVKGVAVTPDGQTIVSASFDRTLIIWSLTNLDISTEVAKGTRYTNAKVVLVGETGVGKTGLALRLCEDRWEATESTHGMIISRLELPPVSEVDMECEVWLWDFAGQPDYRLVHQLFIDETALGVLVFNPQDDNPFEEMGHWEKALCAATKYEPARLLVAARCDRGGITISQRRFEQYVHEHGFAGFLCTGAKTGEGCEELKAAIAKNIPWEHLPWTATSQLFKTLKNAILKLTEDETPLVRLPELRQRLQLLLPKETITEIDLRAVVGLMQGQGVVQMLSFGDFLLLQPAWINRYASVVVRMAREHADEMGVVLEQRVLDGELDYKDMEQERLANSDEKILLRAIVQTFLDRSLCLRQETPQGTMLVFPSYFRRDKPDLPGHPNIFVTYGFSGPLEEIYATLVVRLSYSDGFKCEQLWKDAVDFKTPSGRRVGLAMRKKGEGAAEIVVYFESGVPDDTKVTFIKYVHEHLLARAQPREEVTRLRNYVCPHCDEPMESRETVQKRLARGLKDIICPMCEKRVPLLDLIEEKFASNEFLQKVREMDELAGINLDNESRELILVGHALAIAAEAGQIFRPVAWADWGIDGEIEFKDTEGKASGQRLYLQLKSGDSYLYQRKRDDVEVFTIKDSRHADYWLKQAYPVMLVIRTSDGRIRWLNVTDYLQEHGKDTKQIVFQGEPFSALNVVRLRNKVLSSGNGIDFVASASTQS
jgi:WD40 repeat protein